MPGIEPATSWLVLKHSDPQVNEAVNIIIIIIIKKQIDIHEEIKCGLKVGNSCCYSVEQLWSSRFLRIWKLKYALFKKYAGGYKKILQIK